MVLDSHKFVISDAVTKHDIVIARGFLRSRKVKIDHGNDMIEIEGRPININSVQVELNSQKELEATTESNYRTLCPTNRVEFALQAKTPL